MARTPSIAATERPERRGITVIDASKGDSARAARWEQVKAAVDRAVICDSGSG